MLLTPKSLDGFEVEGVVNSNLCCKIEVIKGETIPKKCKLIRISAGILLNIQYIAQPLHFLCGFLPLITTIRLSEMVMLEPIRIRPNDFECLQPLLIVVAIHNLIEFQLVDGGGSSRLGKLILRNDLCLKRQQSLHLIILYGSPDHIKDSMT